MGDGRRLESLDYFKIIAALLVIAIHTSPLASFSADADFILTRIIARCAVPFFLMITGYFVLPQYLFGKSKDLRRLIGFLRKNLCLYAASVILYLPLNFYAGHFDGVGITDIIRMIIFDGTFYHLWYIPASILGVIIVFLIGRFFPYRICVVICIILYFAGLAGDSYYGCLSAFPSVKEAYDIMFNIFSYTRNGIFYAPLFLAMGAGIAHIMKTEYVRKRKRAEIAACFVISMQLMIIEGLILRCFDMQRHDSMYIALPFCMFFLFQIIIGTKINYAHKPLDYLIFKQGFIRYKAISTWIYILHPMMIVVVRGAAKFLNLEKVFVDNSLIHYIAVCILSVAVSGVASIILKRSPVCIKREERG